MKTTQIWPVIPLKYLSMLLKGNCHTELDECKSLTDWVFWKTENNFQSFQRKNGFDFKKGEFRLSSTHMSWQNQHCFDSYVFSLYEKMRNHKEKCTRIAIQTSINLAVSTYLHTILSDSKNCILLKLVLSICIGTCDSKLQSAQFRYSFTAKWNWFDITHSMAHWVLFVF